MNRPRPWLGGLSVTTMVIVGTLALTAWDRVDKLIESRDAWRDHSREQENEIAKLKQRADDEDARNKAEDAWRRNADKKIDYAQGLLQAIMQQLGIKVPFGPVLEGVPGSVTRSQGPSLGPMAAAPTAATPQPYSLPPTLVLTPPGP